MKKAFTLSWHGGENQIEIGIEKREIYAALIMAQLMAKDLKTSQEIAAAADKSKLAAEELVKALAK